VLVAAHFAPQLRAPLRRGVFEFAPRVRASFLTSLIQPRTPCPAPHGGPQTAAAARSAQPTPKNPISEHHANGDAHARALPIHNTMLCWDRVVQDTQESLMSRENSSEHLTLLFFTSHATEHTERARPRFQRTGEERIS
jgi:hypothetical protein